MSREAWRQVLEVPYNKSPIGGGKSTTVVGAAGRGAGALANQFPVDGNDVVVVEGGDIITEEDFTELDRGVTRAKIVFCIALDVSHEDVRRNHG